MPHPESVTISSAIDKLHYTSK